MGDEKTISVADISDGPCSRGDPGTDVSLPVVELLTGRGFVTGKSGSGKSNSASVIAEKLLDNGFGLLIVDIDGEYYGLKEEYEILHAGGDDECDIQVTPDHAEKLATLALEQNVPIILDVSSFLDESEARELLTAVARQLFVKAKKLKQPFLLLVEEIHEYIPEKGGMDECGRMLIKIAKRGRKHGLGVVGISQRPADVKKDYITQCDWLVWHRLTWNNDTKVVRRIIDGEHAEAVEDLGDGEGFLMTDWSETVKRVQFHRKQTFDAGATPGLEDFERPDLKSVSDDLVSELQSISDEEQARDDTIAELRAQLDEKNSRIAELEAELQDARDLSRMADQFVEAMLEEVEGPAPGRTEAQRLRERHQRREAGPVQSTLDESAPWPESEGGAQDGQQSPEGPQPDGPAGGQQPYDPHAASPDASARPRDDSASPKQSTAQASDGQPPAQSDRQPEPASAGRSPSAGAESGQSPGATADAETATADASADAASFDAEDVAAAFEGIADGSGEPPAAGDDGTPSDESDGSATPDGQSEGGDVPEFDFPEAPEPETPPSAEAEASPGAETADPSSPEAAEQTDGGAADRRPDADSEEQSGKPAPGFAPGGDDETPSFPSFEEPADAPTVGDDTREISEDGSLAFSGAEVSEFGFQSPEDRSKPAPAESATEAQGVPAGAGAEAGDQPSGERSPRDAVAEAGSDDASIAAAVQEIEDREITGATRPEPPSVGDLRAMIRDLGPKTRRMLAYYHEQGPSTPLDAHFVAGGTGDRTDAYAHNGKLRDADLIEHVGRGKYDTCLDDRLDAATDGKLDESDRRTFLARLESLLETPESA
jgi:hypothetical protein